MRPYFLKRLYVYKTIPKYLETDNSKSNRLMFGSLKFCLCQTRIYFRMKVWFVVLNTRFESGEAVRYFSEKYPDLDNHDVIV